MNNFRIFFRFICLLAVFTSYSLQAAPAVDTPQVKPPVTAKDANKHTGIRVLCIRKYREDLDFEPNNIGNNIYPGDYIMVKIDRKDVDSAQRNVDKYRLWIDGICFPNMKARFINESEPALIFQFVRDTSRNSPWQLMYSNPSYWRFHHRVNINMGTLTTEYHNPDKVHQLILFTSIWWVPWVFYTLFILLVFLIIKYGRAFLKDTSLYASNGVKIGFKAYEVTDAEKGIINIKSVSKLTR